MKNFRHLELSRPISKLESFNGLRMLSVRKVLAVDDEKLQPTRNFPRFGNAPTQSFEGWQRNSCSWRSLKLGGEKIDEKYFNRLIIISAGEVFWSSKIHDGKLQPTSSFRSGEFSKFEKVRRQIIEPIENSCSWKLSIDQLFLQLEKLRKFQVHPTNNFRSGKFRKVLKVGVEKVSKITTDREISKSTTKTSTFASMKKFRLTENFFVGKASPTQSSSMKSFCVGKFQLAKGFKSVPDEKFDDEKLQPTCNWYVPRTLKL